MKHGDHDGDLPEVNTTSFRLATDAISTSKVIAPTIIEEEDEEITQKRNLLNTRQNDSTIAKNQVEMHVAFASDVLKNEKATTTKIEEAILRMQRALFLDASSPRNYILRADLYLKLSDVKCASIDLRHALSLNPHDYSTAAKLAYILDMKGMALLEAGQCTSALNLFQEATHFYPYYWPFYFHAALAHVGNGDLTLALDSCNECLSKKANSDESSIITGGEFKSVRLPRAEIYLLRGKLYFVKEDISKACLDFRKAEDLDPFHPECITFVSILRERALTLFDEAIGYIKDAGFAEDQINQNISMGCSESTSSLSSIDGSTLSKTKSANKKEAKERIQRSLQSAIDNLKICIDILPDDTRSHLLLACVYRKLKQYEDALFILRQASLRFWEAVNDKEYDQKDLLAPNYKGTYYHEPFEITRQRNLVLNEIAVDLAHNQKNYDDAITLLNRIIEDEVNMLKVSENKEETIKKILSHTDKKKIEQEEISRQTRTAVREQKNEENKKESTAHGDANTTNDLISKQNGKQNSKDQYQLPADVDYRYLLNRGDCYRAMGSLELAISDYHRAHILAPQNWEIRTRIALVHYSLGIQAFNELDMVGARCELSRAIGYNNKVAHFYLSRGRASYYMNDWAEAYLDFFKVLKLDANDVEAKSYLMRFKSMIIDEKGDKAMTNLVDCPANS